MNHSFILGEKDRYNQRLVEEIAQDPIAIRELLNLWLDDCLGFGVSRLVFEDGLDTKYVVKYEHDSGNANVMEYEIWQEVKDKKKLSKWLAPCLAISPDGRWMIQKKTHSVIKWPKKVPRLISGDFHKGNFGMIGKQFVMHDYAYMKLVNRQNKNLLKMKKVDWDD